MTDSDLAALLRADRLAAGWTSLNKEVASFAIPDGTGGVNPGDRRALYSLVRSLDPRAVLEIGTHIGASTVHLAAALRDGSRTGAALTSVDVAPVNDPEQALWRRFGTALSPGEMVARLGMTSRVSFVVASSTDFLREQAFDPDLIFLDGDHRASVVYREIALAVDRVRPGGLIILHDYYPGGRALWPGRPVITGPWLAVQRLREEGARLKALPLGRLPWPTKAGSDVTSLAVVVRDEG